MINGEKYDDDIHDRLCVWLMHYIRVPALPRIETITEKQLAALHPSQQTPSALPPSSDLRLEMGPVTLFKGDVLQNHRPGRNHLNEEITSLLLAGIGERYRQTISNFGHAALVRKC